MLLLTINFSFSKDKFVELSGGMFFPSDVNFKNSYTDIVFIPSLFMGMTIKNDFYGWIGYQLFSCKGKTVLLETELKYVQYNSGIGIGYKKELNEKFLLNVYSGIYYIAYKEEEKNVENPLTVRGNTLGVIIGSFVNYKIKKSLYLSAGVGYLIANDNIDEEDVSFGGLQIKSGLSLRF